MPGSASGDDNPEPVGRLGEPEERHARPPPASKKKCWPMPPGRSSDDQRHAEHARVEVDGALHIGTDQRDVVDATEFELPVLVFCGLITT